MKSNTKATSAIAAVLMVAASAASADSVTLDRIKDNGSITIGHREASIPFSYLGANQEPVGFSLDLCEKIVAKIEADLGEEIDVNYVPVNSSNRIPLIQNGTVDIECGGTANNKTRQEQVSFSVATFVSQPAWLTMSASGLKEAADLKGQTVVATQGSNAVGFAQQMSTDGLDLNLVQAKDHAESFLMLTSGRAKAFLEDDILLAGLRAAASDPSTLAFLPDSYDKIYYGLMFAKDDAEFKALVDGVLSDMMASGEFTQAYEKWFMQPIPPKNQNLDFPMSEALKERVANPSDSVE
ncbi:amino acid ABC transporter substrate-binding protein [Pseudooceanicola onchidii]|uniref:amino acid ABC transporter substrate-binding protein n=1 Tax=Pseudooceanicola onchidii TaxID=2562279 RepID=UPI0010AA2609|nr:amino acid ABC transporter substrate-binding protein [Pseudooceanicola onchidii]